MQKYQTIIVKYPQFYDFSVTPIDLSKLFCEKKYVHAFPDRISRMCPERLGGRTPLECGKSPRSKIVNIPSVLKGCEKKNSLEKYALIQTWDTRSIIWNIKPCKENILLWFDVFLLIRASFSPPIVSQIELKLTQWPRYMGEFQTKLGWNCKINQIRKTDMRKKKRQKLT